MMPQKITYNVEISSSPDQAGQILVQPIVSVNDDNMVPQHIIFVIDISGSMGTGIPRKLDMVKEATIDLIKRLGQEDTFSIVTFDDNAEIVSNKEKTLFVKNIKRSVSNFADYVQLINEIEERNGTQMQTAFNLIGGTAANHVPITDIQNCRIILLTDGEDENKNLTAAMLIDTMKHNLKSETVPRVITMGIGPTYNANLLSSFGEKTGFNAFIHMKDQNDVKKSFDFVLPFLSAKSKLINLIVEVGSQSKPCSILAVANGLPAQGFLTFDLPATSGEITIKILDETKKACLTTTINPSKLTSDQDVIANSVMEQLKALNLDDKISSKQKKTRLRQLLTLLPQGLVEEGESAFVKKVRDTIIDCMPALSENNNDNNRLRSLVSDLTTTTLAGGQSTAPSSSQKTGIAARIPAYKALTHTVSYRCQDDDIKKVDFYFLDQMVNFSDPNLPRYLASFPPPGVSLEEIVMMDCELLLTHSKYLNKFDESSNLPKAENWETWHFILNKSVKYICSFFPNTSSIEDYRKVMQGYADEIRVRDALKVEGSGNLYGVSLTRFVRKKVGFSRHIAPYTALLLGNLVKKGLLPPGSVRQYEALGLGANDEVKYHRFVVYRTDGFKKLFVIDPTSPRKQIYDLVNRHGHDFYLAMYDYEERGLKGILDNLLKGKGLLKDPRNQIAIPESLIATIKDDAKFEQAGLTCAITCDVPRKPVRLQGDDKHIFEYDAVQPWVTKHGTNPLTRETATTIISATDAKEEIIRLIMEQNKKRITGGETYDNVYNVDVEKYVKEREEKIENSLRGLGVEKDSKGSKEEMTEEEYAAERSTAATVVTPTPLPGQDADLEQALQVIAEQEKTQANSPEKRSEMELEDSNANQQLLEEQEKQKRAQEQQEEEQKAKEQRQKQEQEQKLMLERRRMEGQQKQEEERKLQEELEQKRKEEQERKRQEELEQKRKEEQERKRQEEQEQKRREQEQQERKRQEELERKSREEQEQKRIEQEKQRKLAEALKRAEEEKQQLEERMRKLELEEQERKAQELEEDKRIQDLRRQGLIKKFDDLRTAIQDMHDYGQGLKEDAPEKSKVVTDLAEKLEAKRTAFLTANPVIEKVDGRTFNTLRGEFISLLNTENESMSEYRINWNTICANILIALTGIGLLCIAFKLGISAIIQGRPLFFFQDEQTTREINKDEVARKVSRIQ